MSSQVKFVCAAAAKFTGSGGAIVVLCLQGTSQVQKLQDLCQKEDFIMVKVIVGDPTNNATV